MDQPEAKKAMAVLISHLFILIHLTTFRKSGKKRKEVKMTRERGHPKVFSQLLENTFDTHAQVRPIRDG